MPLDSADWEKMKELLKEQKIELEKSFNATVAKYGKRIKRLEAAFSQVASVARATLVTGAKKEHSAALQKMFDKSALLLLPPLEPGQDGKFARSPSKHSVDDIKKFVNELSVEVPCEIELAKPTGFRLLLCSYSAQTRRRVAAQFIKTYKEKFKDSLGLLLQYDKPLEIRTLQRSAHKFLALIKDKSGGAVQEKTVQGGFLIVNGVRLAPEYLVPDVGRWESFSTYIVDGIRKWRGKVPLYNTADGVFFGQFGAEFAASRGVFELSDLEHDEDDAMDAADAFRR
jgi:hypothetical protein